MNIIKFLLLQSYCVIIIINPTTLFLLLDNKRKYVQNESFLKQRVYILSIKCIYSTISEL